MIPNRSPGWIGFLTHTLTGESKVFKEKRQMIRHSVKSDKGDSMPNYKDLSREGPLIRIGQPINIYGRKWWLMAVIKKCEFLEMYNSSF